MLATNKQELISMIIANKFKRWPLLLCCFVTHSVSWLPSEMPLSSWLAPMLVLQNRHLSHFVVTAGSKKEKKERQQCCFSDWTSMNLQMLNCPAVRDEEVLSALQSLSLPSTVMLSVWLRGREGELAKPFPGNHTAAVNTAWHRLGPTFTWVRLSSFGSSTWGIRHKYSQWDQGEPPKQTNKQIKTATTSFKIRMVPVEKVTVQNWR